MNKSNALSYSKDGIKLSFLILMLGLYAQCMPSAFCESYMEAFIRAKALQDQGDDEGALNAYILAKSLFAGTSADINADARLPLARLYAKCGRYQEADAEYQGLLSYGKRIKYEYGQFLLNQGKFSAATSVFSDLLAQDANDPIALYGMGIALEASDNMDSAKDYYEKLCSVAPESTAAESARDRLERLGQAINARSSAKFFPVDPEFGKAGLGWWNLEKMPIHVYIDDGSAVPGFRTEMKNNIFRAMETWKNASRGKISFVVDPPDSKAEQAWKQAFGKTDPLVRISQSTALPDDPVKSNLHIHWTDSLGGVALGLTWTTPLQNQVNKEGFKDCLIKQGHIWLHTNCLADGSELPKITQANTALLEKQDRVLSEVTIHEFGHALGLPHSSNPKDIMCSGIFALTTKDLVEGRTLSQGDMGSLAEHYNNFEGTGFPQEAEVKASKETSKTKEIKSIIVLVPPGKDEEINARSAASAENKRSSFHKDQELNDVVFDISVRSYEEGLIKLEKILKRDAKNPRAIYLQAVIYVLQHKYSQAESSYKQVLKLAPETALAERAKSGLKKIVH